VKTDLILNTSNYKKILEEIVQSNDIIRFAAICNKFGSIEQRFEKKEKSLLLSEHDTEKLAREGVSTWHYRKQLSSKIGAGQYAMAVYEKITRLTIPLDESSILLVSLDNFENPPKIVNSIKNIIKGKVK